MDNRSIYRKIWVVSFPIILQNIMDAAVNSADVLMLNYVGQDAISAVSLANSMIGILFMFLYGIGTATILESTALICNVVLNAVFIFGLFGAPKLGVVGVGLATTLSRLVQLIGCVIVSLSGCRIKLTLSNMFGRFGVLQKDFFTMAVPAIANDLVWAVAFSMYSVILGHMGNDAVAANSIANVVRNLGTVLCYGIAGASGIVIGQILGRGQTQEGIRVSRIFLKLSFITGAVGGLISLAVMPFALSHASLTPTALEYLRFMLLINTYYITGIAVKTVYFLLCTDEFVKWPWVFKYYFSNKWARNITR